MSFALETMCLLPFHSVLDAFLLSKEFSGSGLVSCLEFRDVCDNSMEASESGKRGPGYPSTVPWALLAPPSSAGAWICPLGPGSQPAVS